MSKVFKLGISSENNKKITEVDHIEVLANKGIIGDRHFSDYNDPYCQLSLIESENIDFYNLKYSLDIPYVNFRRNIVTKGIRLNQLVGKKFKIGSVELEGIDLCRPCRHLTEILGQDNILKEFLRKGGLRCQILSSSRIRVGDKIIC
ncbi:MOSC domain-containing protein [Candidatus Pelagibacter communis]|uniref:MOSC domain-containing protein n=1 Tax=Pelagibacter ubique TaxID=198252 RepID=UPI00094D9E0E|nr:MOSC domain-containing protein [Candidatus Pelagibacter ubique]|tara:strand:+ start:623 stop:1063 length:441 start_codon:yes stop_codon:yes gene_type:complete